MRGWSIQDTAKNLNPNPTKKKMTTFKSPFAPSTSNPGEGSIELELVAPNTQVLRTFAYQYPLKLIAPDPHSILIDGSESTASHGDDSSSASSSESTTPAPSSVSLAGASPSTRAVTQVFVLSYGGGLVSGDAVHLTVRLAAHTRLILSTQGSTKVFKARGRGVVTRQGLDGKIGAGAALCYLPEPCCPFEASVFEQRQRFWVEGGASLLLLDWVSEGRRARGERWGMCSWRGWNEVRALDGGGDSERRLLLRDAVWLSNQDGGEGGLGVKMDGMGVFGTLIVYGPLYERMQTWWMDRFRGLERIGGRNWGGDEKGKGAVGEREGEGEGEGVVWTAARSRGFVLVKFGATEVDAARRWLGSMLKKEGTVEREFGHQGLICLR